jgi:hypothetical protein
MTVKYRIPKLEDVPEAIRTEYKPDPTGGFVLDVDGAVDKARLDEFRATNIELQRKMDLVKDVDPVKYKELQTLQRKLQEKELIDKGEVDKVVELRVQAMKDEHTTLATTLQTTLAAANARLETLLVHDVVKTEALKQGIVATAVDDVVLRAMTVYKMENGNPVPKGADGKIIYGKDGTTPMPVTEWLIGLKKTAPHLFQGSQGSGARGGTGVGGIDLSKASTLEKINAGLQQAGLVRDLPAT